VTDEPQEFMLSIVYTGGQWGSDIRILAPGQTFALDVRKLRDSQEKGLEGKVVPLGATSGHVSWSFRGKKDKVLIGRAQTVDTANGLVSTYECQCVCPWNPDESRITPAYLSVQVGYTSSYQLGTHMVDCNGNDKGWHTISSDFSLSSSNPGVANWNDGGLTATAFAPGQTWLGASWQQFIGHPEPVSEGVSECVIEESEGGAEANCEVQEPQPHHVKVIADNFGFPAGCTTTPVYVRQIKVQIVSEGGVPITHTDIPISETFPTQPNNTCGNGNPAESPCSTLNVVSGTFIDTMSVHPGVPNGSFCNTGINQATACGYTLTSLWATCGGPGFGAANLWRYNGETRSNMVRVNGQATKYAEGHEFFP
jgi:hypothetical protein